MERKEPYVKGIGFNVFKIETDERVTITGGFNVNCGFPSPAADFEADVIDLNKLLIKNKNATFYGIADGDSMKGVGIFDQAIFVIDRSMSPEDGDVAVCYLNGEFTCKRVKKEAGEIYLVPENPQFEPIRLKDGDELKIWGVVTWSINKISRR